MAFLNNTIISGKLSVTSAISEGGTLLSAKYAPISHTHNQYLTSHQSVSSSNNTASWGGTVTVGTVGGTDLKFTMPSNPNTDHYAWSDITGKPTVWNAGSTTWTAGNNVTCDASGTAASKEWSFDVTTHSSYDSYWHVWSGNTSKTILACYPKDNRVTIPNGNLSVSGTISEGGTSLADKYQAKGTYLTSHQSLSGYATETWVNNKGYIQNAGSSPNMKNGTAVTQPGGTNAISIKTPGSASDGDTGIFYLSDDNAYICNSSDNGYTFAVFDKDKGTDFSSADNAAFVVKSDHTGVGMKGDLAVAGSITSGGTAVSLAGHTHDYAASNHTHTSLNTAFSFNNSDIAEGATNLSTTTTAHIMSFYRNGITIPYQMDNSNDGGILRCRGTSENDCIFEMGTWDDSGAGETIQFNYYPTTSQITPTYSVSVPKKSGTIALTSDIPSSLPANGGSADWATSAGRVRSQSNTDWWMNMSWDGSNFITQAISDGGSYLPMWVNNAGYATRAGYLDSNRGNSSVTGNSVGTWGGPTGVGGWPNILGYFYGQSASWSGNGDSADWGLALTDSSASGGLGFVNFNDGGFFTLANIGAGGNIYASSDRRLKCNIKDPNIPSYLSILKNLKLREFNRIEQYEEERKDKYLGLMAQNLEKNIPEEYREIMVPKGRDKKQLRSINEGKFPYLLLGGIQEQQKIIEKQSKEINKLKEENKDLKKRLKAIEKKLGIA